MMTYIQSDAMGGVEKQCGDDEQSRGGQGYHSLRSPVQGFAGCQV